ncbi:putative ABC-type sugar transport system,periplasmic component [Vibrio nigripulchritudo SFn27]|uniref:Putative ABC-type sugar transport system, periplasmic component n=2 Tax=Vibrio nigripulchritudo TaxID=28173 RepID=U4KAV9_9VIBR|nr:extracellular solute-binding protein [Vibrio nigripulchritudo]CCN85604.1 putative ABC-type sugar transport system,periplasmic component [Vibrio nigripulchritudo BLFn1]CCN87491.1 putative ABC-type sugar transport system,periplasmic component [Vibrio nigripulchritudo SFn27]CCN94870.1 putative ABC-type sugar transport system,periplasmic component [Vibrio nigripulchritudo ENn2]CCO40590.1 putative ABC-type sugar transport system,periplasmic component [Vibrio nigripulchritudo SFn135]CCO54667.1 pu
MDRSNKKMGLYPKGMDRRTFLKTSTAASVALAFGLPGMSWADAHDHMLSKFLTADVDWKAHAGETIVLGAMEHPWTQSIAPVLPLFEKLTGIKVKLQKQSETEYVGEMPVKLGAGSPEPDVMMVHALGQFISSGWLEPLEEYYSNRALFDAGWYDADDIFSMANEFPVWSDKVRYSMAVTAEAQTMFCNTKAFEKAGLAIPKTYDQVYEAATKLKSNQMAGIVLRSKSDGTAGTWPCGGFLFSYGGEVIKDGRCVLDSDQAIAAIDMYGRLLKDAGPLGVGNYHWYEVLNDFSAGAAAIAMDSSNFATDFQNPEKSLVHDSTTYAAMPTHANHSAKANIWTWQAGINRHSKKKQAAFLLLTFLNSKPGCALTSANGLATIRNSAWDSKAFKDRFGADAAQAALANLNSGDAEVFKACWFHPKAAQILDAWGIAINEVATGAKTSKAAMTTATNKINDIL